MSFEPRTRLEKILCGVSGAADSARTRIEKAVATAMTSIASAVELPIVTADDNGDLLGVSGGKWAKVAPPAENLFLPFTVVDETPTTTADFADVAAAVAAEKNVIAAVDMGGNTILYLPLQIALPNTLIFCTVADMGLGSGTHEPKIMKLLYAADGCALDSVDLAVAT